MGVVRSVSVAFQVINGFHQYTGGVFTSDVCGNDPMSCSLAGSLLCFLDCYPCKRVRKHATNIVLRKKRSLRRRKSKLHAGKHVGFLKAMLMMNEQKTMEEAAKAYMKVHETQEDVRRSEMTAIIK
ncbi:hypothetical protein Lser_V15G04149 [Lactuca serriola]